MITRISQYDQDTWEYKTFFHTTPNTQHSIHTAIKFALANVLRLQNPNIVKDLCLLVASMPASKNLHGSVLFWSFSRSQF